MDIRGDRQRVGEEHAAVVELHAQVYERFRNQHAARDGTAAFVERPKLRTGAEVHRAVIDCAADDESIRAVSQRLCACELQGDADSVLIRRAAIDGRAFQFVARQDRAA